MFITRCRFCRTRSNGRNEWESGSKADIFIGRTHRYGGHIYICDEVMVHFRINNVKTC